VHRVIWVAAVALVAWWTLLPFSPDLSTGSLQRAVGDIQWVPFVERGRAPLWSDVLGNVALFLPFGLAGWRTLSGRRGRLWTVLAGAALVSLAVESLQLALPARRTSTTDLAVDVLGAACGAAVGRLWEVRGRRAARSWLRRLTGGGRENVLAVLLAACLLVWAVVPGLEVPGDLWEQTQRLSSSFRRFPGWQMWLQRSWHPVLLGAVFAILAGRSGTGSALGRGVFGFGCAVLLGVGLELAQLVAPGRNPDIFTAVGFGAGGMLALALAGAPMLAVRAAVVALVTAGLLRTPLGDNPAPQTLSVLVLGGVLLFIAAGPSARTGVGEAVRLD
jgi:hypothetical protein